MPGVRGIVACCLLAALGFLLTACTGNTTHSVCAVLLAVEGFATADGQRLVPPHGTDPASKICAGATIRTSSDSRVEVACLSNALAHLAEDSVLKIDDITLRKDGNETEDEIEDRSVRCHVLNGRVTFTYHGAEGVSELIAITPHGALTAKFNCVVQLTVTNEATRIICANGSAAFEPLTGGSPVAVEAGFIVEIRDRKVSVTPAAETSLGQQELANTLEVERRLSSLAIARRSTVPGRH